MVPAVVPVTTVMLGAVVLPEAMVKFAVRPPPENWIMASSMVPVDPEGGVTEAAKVSVTVPVMVDGKAELRVGVTANCCWKPTWVLGIPARVTVGAVAAFTVNVYCFVPVALLASVAVTVKVPLPAVDAVPVMAPVLDRESPEGRLPVVTANL